MALWAANQNFERIRVIHLIYERFEAYYGHFSICLHVEKNFPSVKLQALFFLLFFAITITGSQKLALFLSG